MTADHSTLAEAKESVQPLPAQTMEVLRGASTGTIADGLAMLGIDGTLPGIRPSRGFEDTTLVGPASTMRFAQVRPDSPKVASYELIESFQPGSIMVLDGKGMDCHWTGDNMGAWAQINGLVGVVVWGGARDIGGWRELEMPLYCTGSATRDKPSNVKVEAGNVPIEIAGVTVKPGDIIVADEDGVVSIPIESIEFLMEAIKIVLEVEAEKNEAVKRGTTAAELAAINAKKKKTLTSR